MSTAADICYSTTNLTVTWHTMPVNCELYTIWSLAVPQTGCPTYRPRQNNLL